MNGNNNEEETPGKGWTNGALPPAFAPHTLDGKLQLYQHHRRWIGLNSSWSRIGNDDTELSKRTSSSSSGISLVETPEEQGQRVRALIAQLCESFYKAGWATGTGGGISIRVKHNDDWRVFVAPSGLQKEDLIGDDIFELDMNRNVVQYPFSNPTLRQSACTPLWYVIYRLRPTATAVLHTHSPNAVYATLLDPTETSSCLRITHLEMLKGVGNHAYDDFLTIPIIDNRPTEDQLADQLAAAVQQYPKTNAVLVRRHGLYVWGDSWEQCKTQAESIDYVLAAAVQMKQMGIDPAVPPKSGTYRDDDDDDDDDDVEPVTKKQKTGFHGVSAADNADDLLANVTPLLPRDGFKALLLDIEGCTSSIAFVKEVLFPYVRQHLLEFLEQRPNADWLPALQQEVQSHGGGDVMTTISDCVTYLMDRDIKSAALKELQGQMWQAGYDEGELQGHVYADMKPMLEWMQGNHIPVYIYSSGSVKAQKLLFGHSTQGDLLPLLAGHFDIPSAGGKKESTSYQTIATQLGLQPSEIVFVSDAEDELVAARQAGIGKAVMSVRPGNVPMTAVGKGFPAIYSLLQLCGA
ncbi:methylthioribulose-1-phosphate dehydratase [Fistulifera solaris]|uniref:Probable methylthioribulose-1-phosphate dehydratase n=1 Tax=Fistulifera solaris TaxID=1519565 RepID=A0A1Z5JRC8_FISSO|nr:methylthioribulose-1-phosphate dehydratase [Fistulifera solaris]|eukprot:GAX16575.1 methylthioribulose-1-phosphate dehydratase [Fistulifera solaris]